MLILVSFIWLLTLLYVVLMLVYARGWQLQKEFIVPENFTPKTRVSVIIPARNEAHNISKCISSILANDYPNGLLDIIVVDDHSTDKTFETVHAFQEENVRCLKLEDYLQGQQINSYKKKALETGIAHSNGELIVTTDADCSAPATWLKNIAALYEQQQSVMIVAPVAFTSNGSVVQIFQSLDFMTMQGITAAAHRLQLGGMSNGANLAFSKNAFFEVDGYTGVDHLASGDDYLLMMKMQKAFPNKIGYLKSANAIVQTAPQPDWKSFFNQRMRWASKSGKYDDKKLTAILLLVYLFNVSLVVLFIAGFFQSLYLLLLAGALMIKTASELFFLLRVSIFFGKTRELLWFPLLQPLHILYIVSAGLMGFVGKYNWKDRSVK
ncbi:MAG TPA: glycosyltransferase [Flavipsychrobacter sp.]|nr:glycosyltransferase [Flavipsychrobacter sp.]